MHIVTLVDKSRHLELSLTICPAKQLKSQSIVIYFKRLPVSHLFDSHEVMSIINLSSHELNLFPEVTFEAQSSLARLLIYDLIICCVLPKVLSILPSIVFPTFIRS